MVPLGIDKTIDKIKMMEGRTSSIRKAVQIAFSRAMNHLSIVQDEPVSDLSDMDWCPRPVPRHDQISFIYISTAMGEQETSADASGCIFYRCAGIYKLFGFYNSLLSYLPYELLKRSSTDIKII